MKFIGIIPARYASTRFPAKPLAMLGGKTVIQRVYEQVSGILDEAYVATDDERIESAVKAFGGKVVMTSVNHKSGTDRCYEAYCKVGSGYDVIVNIQGDEPFIQRSQLEAVKACFNDESTQIATLVKPFTVDDGFEALENVNSPKVVVDKNMNALYFSRSIIPYQRNKEKAEWLQGHTYYKHIGLYAYRAAASPRALASVSRTVADVMIPLVDVRCLDAAHGHDGPTLIAVEEAVAETGYSRFPVRSANGALASGCTCTSRTCWGSSSTTPAGPAPSSAPIRSGPCRYCTPRRCSTTR